MSSTNAVVRGPWIHAAFASATISADAAQRRRVARRDLRGEAAKIDTAQCAVHLLTGEYDYSATVAHGQAAHDAIAGSTFAAMPGVGHFPMSENPEAFIRFLLPVLDRIGGQP